jgi:hypothetical protein
MEMELFKKISLLSEREAMLNVIKREIKDDPEIARLYYEAYQGIASLFPEGSEGREECLRIVEIAKIELEEGISISGSDMNELGVIGNNELGVKK